MKTFVVPILFVLMVGAFAPNAIGMVSTPFDYKGSGVEITNFEMDFKDIELILDVDVSGQIGTVEITFEREFFDSTYLGADDEFTIIADGELVYYKETQTNLNERTLKFNLVSGTQQVEIFGTKLMGLPFETEPIKQEEKIIFTEQTDRVNELLSEKDMLIQENEILEKENNFLKEENKRLDGRIFELENLVSSLEHQITNLNALVLEQVKVIYNWVLG